MVPTYDNRIQFSIIICHQTSRQKAEENWVRIARIIFLGEMRHRITDKIQQAIFKDDNIAYATPGRLK